jgi:hypothetical protein
MFAMTKTKFTSPRLFSFTAAAIVMVVLMSQGVFAQKQFTRFSDGAVEIQFGPEFNQVIADQNILLEGSSFEGNFKSLGKDSIVTLNSRILRYKLNNGNLGADNVTNPQTGQNSNTKGLIFGTGALRFTAGSKKVEFTDFIIRITPNPVVQVGTLVRVDVEIQGVLYIRVDGEVSQVGVQQPLFKGTATINSLEVLFGRSITLSNLQLTFASPDPACSPGPEPCPVAEKINQALGLSDASKFAANGSVGLATIFLQVSNAQ